MPNRCAEIKLRAERRAGEILAGMEKQHGARLTTGFHDVRTLSDLGISKLQSHRWQAVAGVPPTCFAPVSSEWMNAKNIRRTVNLRSFSRCPLHPGGMSAETSP